MVEKNTDSKGNEQIFDSNHIYRDARCVLDECNGLLDVNIGFE